MLLVTQVSKSYVSYPNLHHPETVIFKICQRQIIYFHYFQQHHNMFAFNSASPYVLSSTSHLAIVRQCPSTMHHIHRILTLHRSNQTVQ